jgi:anti-sigma-K factor RskA
MSATTQTRPHTATRGGVDSRLPWWALALPMLAFVTLLALIYNPSDAHAAGGDPAITHLVERVQQLMAR